MTTNATSTHLSPSSSWLMARKPTLASMRAHRVVHPDVPASWLSVLATSSTPAAANARTVRADGQAHFSFTSSSAPAAPASRGQRAECRVGDGGLGQAHLGQDAEQVGELQPLRQRAGRLGQRAAIASIRQLDHLLGRDLAAGDRLAHLQRVHGPEVAGKLVVGDQDHVRPADAVRQVKPPGPVQDLGLHARPARRARPRDARWPRPPRSPAPTSSRGARDRPGTARAARGGARRPRSRPPCSPRRRRSVEWTW